MEIIHTKAATLAATLFTFGSFAGGAKAATFVLDSTNGYEITVTTGFTIAQPLFEGGTGQITFTGATAALGTSTTVDFSSGTFTAIGNTSKPGGNSPLNFADNLIAFTLRDDSSMQLYDATITFFRGLGGGRTGGTLPTPDNVAGLVININTASIPEPSSALLMGLGAIGLVVRRKRAI